MITTIIIFFIFLSISWYKAIFTIEKPSIILNTPKNMSSNVLMSRPAKAQAYANISVNIYLPDFISDLLIIKILPYMALIKTNITDFLTCQICQVWKNQNYLKK